MAAKLPVHPATGRAWRRHEPGRPPGQARRPRRLSFQALLGSALALCAGLAIAWVDTRPRWDDTGVTAGALLIAAATCSLISVRPWLVALLVAGPILVAELSDGPAVLLAVAFTLAGAYAGALVRRRAVRS